MAKIRASASTFFASDLLDCVVRLPEHVSGDLLLIIVAKDDATGGAFTTPAGWTKGGEGSNGASGANTVRGAWYYLVAASSAETNPTVSSTDADTWSAVAVSIRGVHATPIDTSNGNGITDSTGNPYPAASVTTGFNDSLVFYAICSDGGVSPVAAPGFTTAAIADSGSDSCALAFKVQRTAGAAGTCDFYASGTADESVLFTIAIRDGSSGAILPGYPNSDVATIVRPLKGANLTFTSDALDANSDNFTQLAGTWANPDTVYQVDASPLTFVDVTTAATNATDADVIPFPATEATTDYFAIRYSSAFRAVRFDRAGCTAGVAGVCAREYLATGAVWKTLPDFFDSTTSFTTAVGDHHICGWTIPADWTSQSLNGVSGFWIRFRITTIYTTNPTISQVFVSTSLALFHDTLTGRSDAGVSPLFDATNVTPAFSGNLMSGGAYSMVSVVNLSAARLMGTYLLDSPRDSVDVGFRTDGGIAIGLLDSTNLVKAWCVGAADSKDLIADKRNIFVIQVAQATDTSLLSNSPTMTDIKRILLMANNRYGACTQSWNPLLNVGTLKVSGGGSAAPIDYDELVKVANAYPCPLIDGVTNIGYAPIQIGGVDAVNFQASGFTLTFPQQALVANKKTSFHCDTNVVGIIVDARAGDTCKMTSAKMASLSPYLFKFEATASASATYDFTGLVVDGATVTLRAVYTFSGITFASCPSFTQTSAVIDGCTFSDTKVTANNPGLISNCAFTSGGTGHAIEATTAGTYAWDNNTLTGYGADGTTDAAFYNNSGDLITLNLANYGDQIPTIRNGVGASTVINPLPRNINVTGMPTAGANCRLQIDNVTALTADAWAATTAYSSGDKVLRSTGVGTENTAGLYFAATTSGTSAGAEPTWDTTPGNTTADGSVVWTCYKILFYDADPTTASLLLTYNNAEEFIIGDTYRLTFAEMNGATSFKIFETSGIVSASGFDVAVAAEASAVYAANAIDGSSAAVTNIYTTNYGAGTIVFDANLDFTNPKSYAFYCYELTTSPGMWNFWGGVTALDVANYRNNTDIVSIYFDESAGFVKQEDSDTSRWFRSDGARPYLDPTSGGCGIAMNWKNPVYIAALADIAAIKAKTDNLPSDPADQSLLMAEHATTQAAIAGLAIPSAAGNATAVRAELAAELTQVTELHRFRGLDAANPVTSTVTDITSGGIVIELTGDGILTTTATRLP